MQPPTLTRRRSIALTGTTIALGAAGLTLASGEASAEVSGDFQLTDATLSPDDNHLNAIWATVSGSWSYANLDAEPDEWRAYLLADDEQQSGAWEAIGMSSGPASAREATGSYALRGEVTASSHYDAVDVADGQAVELAIPLSVLFMVRSSAGDTLASAEATDTVAVTVEPGGAISSVDGSGTIFGQDDAGDPTPTLPGGA